MFEPTTLKATVLMFPSDHFVYPEKAFVAMASRLAGAAGHLKHLDLGGEEC